MIKLLTLAIATFLASAVHAQSCVKSLRPLSSCGNGAFRYGQATCGNGRSITVFNNSFSCTSEAALTQLGEQKCAQFNYCPAPPVTPIVYGGGGGGGGSSGASYSTTFVSKPSSITIAGSVATVVYSDIHCASSFGYAEAFTRKIYLDLNIAGNANFANALSASLGTRSRKFEGLSINCPSAPSISSYPDYDGYLTRRNDYGFPAYCTVVSLNSAPTQPPTNCVLP